MRFSEVIGIDTIEIIFERRKIMGCLGIICVALLVGGLEFIITAGFVYLLTWCVGAVFSWKLTIAVFIVLKLLRWAFRGGEKR
jgi:hypothetical protein